MGIAFMWYWPVTLALVSKAAPAKVNSTLMGGAFLALFVGIVMMGWVGSFYDQMSPAAFWTLDAAIGFAGALIIFAVRKPLSRALAIEAAETRTGARALLTHDRSLPSPRPASSRRSKPSEQSSPAANCARRGRRCSRTRATAPAATFINARPRRCSAKARSTPRSCSSANSPATRRIWPAARSSARPGNCSTPRWKRPGSTARRVYVTNAVKHFKFVARGKRRIHSKPDAGEITACRWWIGHERELIRPPVTVALGATAARSLFGKA